LGWVGLGVVLSGLGCAGCKNGPTTNSETANKLITMTRTMSIRTNLFEDLVLVAAEAVKHVKSSGQLTVTVSQVVDHLRSVSFSV